MAILFSSSMKHIKNIVYGLLIVVLCIFALMVVISNIDTPLKVRLYAVQSGSMEPALHTGSVVLTKEFPDYKIGDIITYQNSEVAKIPVTHRIYRIKDTPEGKAYISKGDANNVDDKAPIIKSQILGKVIFTLPLFGYVVQFSKTQFGFLAIVVIPATLIIYSELIKVKNEIVTMYSRRKSNKKETRDKHL